MKGSTIIFSIIIVIFGFVGFSGFYFSMVYNYNVTDATNLTTNADYTDILSGYVVGNDVTNTFESGTQEIVTDGTVEEGFLIGNFFTSAIPAMVDFLTGRYLNLAWAFFGEIIGLSGLALPTWITTFLNIILIVLFIFALVSFVRGWNG